MLSFESLNLQTIITAVHMKQSQNSVVPVAMAKFQSCCCVRSYHQYQAVWAVAVGQNLQRVRNLWINLTDNSVAMISKFLVYYYFWLIWFQNVCRFGKIFALTILSSMVISNCIVCFYERNICKPTMSSHKSLQLFATRMKKEDFNFCTDHASCIYVWHQAAIVVAQVWSV